MRIGNMEFNKEQLVAAILSGELDWGKITNKAIFTEEEIKEYKDQIKWNNSFYNGSINRYLNNHNEFLDELMEKGYFNLKNDSYIKNLIGSYLAKDKWFITKWCKKGILNFRDIICYRSHNNCDKFKPTEVVQIVGPAKVGDKATLSVGSDRYPYEVIWTNKSGLKIKLRKMKAINHGDYYNQDYTYESDINGEIIMANLNSKGNYKSNGLYISIGKARQYLDPSF